MAYSEGNMNNTTKFHRITIDREFLMVPRTMINDRHLTDRAHRLLLHLLDNPDTWVINLKTAERYLGWSRDKVTGAWKDIEKAGYGRKKTIGRIKGQFAYHYDLANYPKWRSGYSAQSDRSCFSMHGGAGNINTESINTNLNTVFKEEQCSSMTLSTQSDEEVLRYIMKVCKSHGIKRPQFRDTKYLIEHVKECNGDDKKLIIDSVADYEGCPF